MAAGRKRGTSSAGTPAAPRTGARIDSTDAARLEVRESGGLGVSPSSAIGARRVVELEAWRTSTLNLDPAAPLSASNLECGRWVRAPTTGTLTGTASLGRSDRRP